MKLTKNELRAQQHRLQLLYKYLPTLQLKKAMLQAEVNLARVEIEQCLAASLEARQKAEAMSPLLNDLLPFGIQAAFSPLEIKKRYENLAGVEVPYFDGIVFKDFNYSLFDSPAWLDGVIIELRDLKAAQVQVEVAKEKKLVLEKELKDVSIRVNLFEKILIPRALGNIRKITVFLQDQMLAAVCRAKVAKSKIQTMA